MEGEANLRALFHPAVGDWVRQTFGSPTPPQIQAWPKIKEGAHVLVAAPTGSGKTLAAFLSAIDALVRESQVSELPAETRVLYVSPLKALSADIEHNLRTPLAGIEAALESCGGRKAGITTAVRTGDTLPSERARQSKSHSHIFVTTPESLFILLSSEGGRRMLKTVRTVIVDEIHALVRDKRGSHLALSLERLDALVKQQNEKAQVQRIGLSATQKPITLVRDFLVGAQAKDRLSFVVDTGHRRAMDLSLCVPGSPLEGVMPAEAWAEIYDQLATLVDSHKTTLIFTNTRRLAERLTRFLAERVGEDVVTSHHGSLSRLRRQAAEKALKEGRLKALVATASLELGIDVGDVDLVCQIGSPGSIATLLQRVGRSGHFVGGTPKGRLFPLSRDDLVESVALLKAAAAGELDLVRIPEAPLDILAQHIVAMAGAEEWDEAQLFETVRRAYPYRDLSRRAFDQVVSMLATGYATARGRRGAYLHHDQIGHRIKGRRGARLAAITNGGAIADNFDYEVLLEPSQVKIGTVHEDFAIESMAGDIFQLGNASYQIVKVDPGILRVGDAHGQPPTIPFWVGEAPARTDELSEAVSRLREQVAQVPTHEIKSFIDSLTSTSGIPKWAVEQLVTYLRAALSALGHMPSQSCLVVERFFDEAEGMHVVLHSPFGSRVNRAFGLALRKRFCRSFNVELQAAATEDALVLSLGPMHSFPLESMFQFLSPNTVREVLVQALLDAPLFQTRWRHNASRALAILRFRGGKKVPPRFQRMQSDDLLALCFPDQVACLENIAGDREIPDHPLVTQSIHDSLTEAMDIDGLENLLKAIQAGTVACVARDLTEPSPLAHEILSARPYAFLDDAPLEERRTQAVQMRRLSETDSADFGVLDPEAILRVRQEAWPDPRDADELHDALLVYGSLRESEVIWPEFVAELTQAGRIVRCQLGSQALYFATERAGLAVSAYPDGILDPRPGIEIAPRSQVESILELVRGRLELCGPTTGAELSAILLIEQGEIEAALLALEGEGFVLRGSFEKKDEEEFCERRLLARIHRLTLGRLRREIEPVSPGAFLRFLTHHQGLSRETQREGPSGTLAVVAQLSGYPISGGSLEDDVLRARVRLYSPAYLDQLCLSGQIAWRVARRPSGREGQPRQQLTKASPLILYPGDEREIWALLENAPGDEQEGQEMSADARLVAETLHEGGALFFRDVLKRTSLLPSQGEKAIAELIARGALTTDSFAGVRILLTPESKRRERPRGPQLRRVARPFQSLEAAGRLSPIEGPPLSDTTINPLEEERTIEGIAWILLRRWGVVFRKVLERESGLPPWGMLLRTLHRLEARGEIRGGRFVSGFSGEQFATTGAIEQLRKLRRRPAEGEVIRLAGTDPLNLVGILTPGGRLAASAKNQLLLVDGIPCARLENDQLLLTPPEPGEARLLTEQEARRALVGSRMGSQEAAYLPRSAE